MKKLLAFLMAASLLASCSTSSNNNNTEQGNSGDSVFEMQNLAGKMSRGLAAKAAETHVDYNYTVSDLVGQWVCNTESGDLSEYFAVDIEAVSEDEFAIANFHNLGKKVNVKISGGNLEYSGKLSNEFSIVDSKGTLDKSYGLMKLNYSIVDGDGARDEFVIQLSKDIPISSGAPAR